MIIGKKFNDIIAKYKELKEKTTYIEKNGVRSADPDPKKLQEGMMAQKSIFNADAKLRKIIYSKYSVMGFYNSAEKLGEDKNSIDRVIRDAYEKIIHQKYVDVKMANELMNANIPLEEFVNRANEYLQNKAPDEYNADIAMVDKLVVRSLKGMKTIDEIEAAINQIAAEENIDADSLVDDHIFDVYSIENEALAGADKFEKLRKDHANDQMYLDMLKEAEKICLTGTNEITAIQTDIAESIGRAALNKNFNLQKQYYAEKGLDIEKDIEVGALSIVVNNHKKHAECAKMVMDSKPQIDNACKAKLLELADYINDNDLLNKDRAGEFLLSLVNQRGVLLSKLDGGSYDEIKSEVDKYKALEAKIDGAVKIMGDAATRFDFSNNMSFARQTDIPFKYRENVKDTSNLRVFMNMMSVCKKYELDFKEFLNDPYEFSKGFVKNIVEKNNRESGILDLSTESLVTNFVSSGDLFADYQVKLVDLQAIDDAFGMLQAVTSEETKVEFGACTKLFNQAFIEPFIYQHVPSNYETLANLLVVEKEDRDITKLGESYLDPDTMQSTKFNPTEYINQGKTTPLQITSRIVDAYNKGHSPDFVRVNTVKHGKDKLENIQKACTEDSKMLLNNPNIELSKTHKMVLKAINNQNLDKISTHRMDIFKAELAIDCAKKGNAVANDSTDLIKTIADLKKEYDSRNFFYKWFGSETRALKNTFNSLSNVIKEAIGEESFNSKLEDAMREQPAEQPNEVNPQIQEVNNARVPEEIPNNEIENGIIQNEVVNTQNEPIRENEISNNDLSNELDDSEINK